MNPFKILSAYSKSAFENIHCDVFEKKCASMAAQIDELKQQDAQDACLLEQEKEVFQAAKKRLTDLEQGARSIVETNRRVSLFLQAEKQEFEDLVARFEHAAQVALELQTTEKKLAHLRHDADLEEGRTIVQTVSEQQRSEV